MMNMGITTEGTMIMIRLFPPLLLPPTWACEDEVDEREEEEEEEAGEGDVGD